MMEANTNNSRRTLTERPRDTWRQANAPKAADSARNRTGRRRQRKPPVKALLICAALIFLVGFLMGFLVRGWFLPQEQQPQGSGDGQSAQQPQESTPPPDTTPVQTDPPADWRTMLVNRENPLPEDFAVELTALSGGARVDKRCYSDLQNLLSACKAAGHAPTIVVAYRSPEEQQAYYDAAHQSLVDQGMSAERARKRLINQVPLPDCSEHQTGLAVDLVDAMNQNLDSSQSGTDIARWLQAHSWEYGFIQRYPEGKAEITGIHFEPWHYRYVGTEIAAEIHDLGVTLEEYLQAKA